MVNDSIVIGQIGCGYWGPNLLRNFSAQPGAWVKWVADESEARQGYVKQHFPRTETTADYRVVLSDPDVDAVVIATPAFTHFQLAREALLAGKHVFVEKPLAMSTAECDELAALSMLNEKTLMVGHTFLYNPAVRYIKSLLQSGDPGELLYIYMQRLNLGKVRTDVNAWWNLAPHDVSILLYLMENELPATVTASGIDYIQPGIEDVVFATLTWPNRATGHIHVSWLDPGKVRQMTLVCNKKMIVYNDISDDKIAIYDKGVDRVPMAGEGSMDYDTPDRYQLHHRSGDILLPKISAQEPLSLEAAHFLECIRTKATPLTGPMHGRQVVKVMEAVQASLKDRSRMISLEEVSVPLARTLASV